MKKSIILALMMGGVLTFTSCEKDKEPITNPATNQTVSTQMTDQQVEAKIKDFIAKVKSGDKNTASMSAEDAIWNIEAALNYTFCINEVDLIGDYEDDISIDLSINDEVSFDEIISIYNLFKAKISNKLTMIDYISVIDVDLEKNKITFTVSKTVSNKSTTYTSTDWWYGEDYGDCSGNNAPADGASVVTGGIRNNHLIFAYGTYWTDPYLDNFNGLDYPNPNEPQGSSGYHDNYEDYLSLFQYTWAPVHYCITSTELNFYEYNIWQIMVDRASVAIVGGITGSEPCILHGVYDYKTISPIGYGVQLSWTIRYTYGVKHTSGGGPK